MLSSGCWVRAGGGGPASIPALSDRLGKFPIDSGSNCLYRVTAAVSRRVRVGRMAASSHPHPGALMEPGCSAGERGHSMHPHFLASLLVQANQSTLQVLCVCLSIRQLLPKVCQTVCSGNSFTNPSGEQTTSIQKHPQKPPQHPPSQKPT